jgi:hypothetical protein
MEKFLENCSCLNDIIDFAFYSYEKCLYVRVTIYLIAFITLLKVFLKCKSIIKRKAYPRDLVILHQFPQGIYTKDIDNILN